MNSPASDMVETAAFMSGYDAIKKKSIPSFKDVGSNLTGAGGYAFVGKRLADWIVQKWVPDNKAEAMAISKIIMVPFWEGIGRKYLLGMPQLPFGQMFMKSLVATGAQWGIRKMM